MTSNTTRRPGELAFTLFLAVVSLFLLWTAFGISGFEALSSPGAVPMATTFAMLATALIVAVKTARRPAAADEKLGRDVLPPLVFVFALFLLAYALLLKPLGFLPTSALFLVGSVKILSGRGWGFAVGVSALSLLVIYVLFRIVFTVLMPAGIVPEGEILQALRGLFGAGR
ncbi:tripartite tricarboxylate transporter TctB family protein [Mangrovibrevibacter kandeliae]|uniref:tripartite tricarboxylate transporter TctB family protein n=1 Tax=Mangrovibrevibacter kandeliae TaxID=2968473 RepID=UPI002118BB0F|nr:MULTISPECIES: tripartite tricarboxylate transporter TctB family protein [unclassified Aurantimonas]MCQ8782953.1 tripartite tricarboxylate transporter TctB family protein [Aurantimonas sp. CSK15Z-1]MCW4115853.1 tripartite tricarboxylate transporter TctB family protein [Aurantimonas sp. MSK8Z-1]